MKYFIWRWCKFFRRYFMIIHYHLGCWCLFSSPLDTGAVEAHPHPCTSQKLSCFCHRFLCLFGTLYWLPPIHLFVVSDRTSFKNTTFSISVDADLYLLNILKYFFYPQNITLRVIMTYNENIDLPNNCFE